jgi:hypothetical protein
MLFLAHWHPDEAEERKARLLALGHEVRVLTDGARASSLLARGVPEAVIIDLGRLPSHGRQLALWLRERKQTRGLPIVFVGGEVEKVERLARDLPDAVYTTWPRVRGALRKALARRAVAAPIPVQRAGYSGTPLAQKLSIKAAAVVALVGAPDGFRDTLEGLPDGVELRAQARGRCDVIVLFCRSRAELEKRFAAAHRALAEGGGLWVAWPKKASGVATDLTEDAVRAHGLASGLVDNKVCAVDATWSGLRFMRRRAK